jgi:hypothetical protein
LFVAIVASFCMLNEFVYLFVHLAGARKFKEVEKDSPPPKSSSTVESSNSAASATTPDATANLDTADSGSPRKLAAEAILPESSSSWMIDCKEAEDNEATADRAPDLENVRQDALTCNDFFVEGLDFFDTKGDAAGMLTPSLMRSNSNSSTMTDSSAFSKDLWAELACHMQISDGTFESDLSNESKSTLTGNNVEIGQEDEIGVEDLNVDDIGMGSTELLMPGSPEVEMLETSSLMEKKQAWTTLLADPLDLPRLSPAFQLSGGANLDNWQSSTTSFPAVSSRPQLVPPPRKG